MGKKILILSGSPRKGAGSETLRTAAGDWSALERTMDGLKSLSDRLFSGRRGERPDLRGRRVAAGRGRGHSRFGKSA